MKVVKNIFFMIIAVTIFFGALEVVQRVKYALRCHNSYWLRFGFMDKPKNYREMMNPPVKNIEVPYTQHGGYIKNNPEYAEYKINSHGFRGKEINTKKEKGTYRVITLGGSTTFCTYVGDGFTYPEYLEKMTGFEVINAGVPSATIWQIRWLFEKEIAPLKPDMIIINSVFNNFYHYAPHLLFKTEGLVNNVNRFLLNRSLFYVTLREKISLMTHGDATYIWLPPVRGAARNFLNYEIFWKRLEDEYRDIVNSAKGHNIKVVILKEPILLRKGHGILFDETMRPVYEKIYTFFDTLGVQVIDALAHFNAHPAKDKLFIDDGLHLTPEGNKYLASIIAKEIKHNNRDSSDFAKEAMFTKNIFTSTSEYGIVTLGIGGFIYEEE